MFLLSVYRVLPFIFYCQKFYGIAIDRICEEKFPNPLQDRGEKAKGSLGLVLSSFSLKRKRNQDFK